MSKHFHLRFIKLPAALFNATRTIYRVESFDFSEDDQWEEMGHLHVIHAKEDYAYHPSNQWVAQRILPPKLYALSEEEQDKAFRQRLAAHGLGNGAYARKVHEFARACLDDSAFPDLYPEYAVTMPGGLPIHR
jgi:hypothetical protein